MVLGLAKDPSATSFSDFAALFELTSIGGEGCHQNFALAKSTPAGSVRAEESWCR